MSHVMMDKGVYGQWIIHDNLCRPFRVTVSVGALTVERNTESRNLRFQTENFEWMHILTIVDYEGYWPGLDIDDPWDENIETAGNTFLVKLHSADGRYKYLNINMDIITFYTEDPIIHYTSVIGNNNVPYPIAFTSNHAYLMGSGGRVHLRHFREPEWYNSYDVTLQFHGHIGFYAGKGPLVAIKNKIRRKVRPMVFEIIDSREIYPRLIFWRDDEGILPLNCPVRDPNE